MRSAPWIPSGLFWIGLTQILGLLPISAQPLPEVSIARFADNAAGAFSYTFDDGSQSQSTIGAPYLEEFGMRGTFMVVAGYTREKRTDPLNPDVPSNETWSGVSWEEWRVLLAKGHELAGHTMTHPHMPALDSATMESQIRNSVELQQSKTGSRPTTFAFPFTEWNPLGMRIASRYFHFVRQNMSLYGQAHAASTAQIHGIDQPWDPLPSAAFHQHLAYTRTLVRSGKLWVTTFWEASRYEKARDSTKVRILQRGNTSLVFQADCLARTPVCDDSLTFLVAVPDDISQSALATQDEKSLPVSRKPGLFLVSANPMAGAVSINWGSTVGVGHQKYAGPAIRIAGASSVLSLPVPLGPSFTLELWSLDGRRVWRQSYRTGFSTDALLITGIAPGIYRVLMRGGIRTFSGKVVVAAISG